MWTIDVDSSESRLATGSADSELRLYAIQDPDSGRPAGGDSIARGSGGGGGTESGEAPRQFLVEMGSVKRQAGERAATVRFSTAAGAVGGEVGGVLLTCQSAGKVVEVYRLRSAAEAAKKLKRRKKRKREKQDKRGEEAGHGEAGGRGLLLGKQGFGMLLQACTWCATAMHVYICSRGAHLCPHLCPHLCTCADAGGEEDGIITASDELELVATLRSKHKVRSFAYRHAPAGGGRKAAAHPQLVLSLTNNSMEVRVEPGNQRACICGWASATFSSGLVRARVKVVLEEP